MATVKSRINDEAESCFTSMIDIVFLLLIFFILQPFKCPDMRLKTELPREEGRSERLPSIATPVRVDVRGRGDAVTYLVDGRAAGAEPRRLLTALLRAADGQPKDLKVVLDSDQEVNFTHVLAAYDQCLCAELVNVSFAAAPEGQRLARPGAGL